MRLAEDNDLIQALAAQRTDQAFRYSILPWRSRCNRPVADTHCLNPRGKDTPISSIIVAYQIRRRRRPRKRLGDLSGQPLGRGMPRNLKPQQPSPAVSEHQEGKQAIEGHRRDNAHIDCCNRLGVVAQKGLPALRWRFSASRHVLRNRRLGHLKTQHQQFAMDAWRAPQRVLPAHPPDQIAQVTINPRPPCPIPRFPAPISLEATAVPTKDGLWFHHLSQIEQPRPNSSEPAQQGSIAPT